MAARTTGYRSNQLLKKANEKIEWTVESIQEYAKCKKNPLYFIETYIKIVSLDKGLVPFELYKYQKQIIRSMHNNRNTIIATARQVGKSTSAVGYVLWYILFNRNKRVALLANKGDTAKSMLAAIKLAYQHLPKWLQQGIVDGGWNKTSIELENGCSILAEATSSDSVRGKAINLLIIDEAAHIDNWNEFFMSVYPTISSGKTSKIVLISTPNGLNDFYVTWAKALRKENEYHPIMVKWNEVPGRDEKWRIKTLSDMNDDTAKFDQEYNVEFLGSSGTLINGSSLKRLGLAHRDPEVQDGKGLRQWYPPEKDHVYAMICDVSRGKGLDYSAFQVIDITSVPYRQVCTYRSNAVTPGDYTSTINHVGRIYNNAHVLVEINDLGGQVVDALHETYEYDYIIYTTIRGKGGKQLGTFGGANSERGVRTTTPVKATGCAMLKLLIEQEQLILVDKQTIDELNRFSKKNNSYEAEKGAHDDLVMGLVLFSWMTDQQYFKELTDQNIVDSLRDSSEEDLTASLLPFGFITNGLEDLEGETWFPADDFANGW